MIRTTVFALALAASSPALAATFFADQTSFDAATTGAVTTALPNSGSVGLAATAGPLSFTSQSGSLFFGNSYEWSSLIPGNDLAISAPESFTISFASAVTAFSMLVHEPTANVFGTTDGCNAATCVDTTFRLEVLDGASILDSLTFNPTDDVAEFVGVTNTTAFSAVRIVDVTNNLDNEYFGAFTTASIATVPLPAGLPLMVLGLGVLGVTCRRRKA